MATPSKVVTIPSPPRPRIAHMSPEQLEAFLRAAKAHGPRSHCMFLFAVSHGARASEICNLRLSDLNFKTEQVRVARMKGSLESVQHFAKVKGNGLFDEQVAFKKWLKVREPDADSYVFNSQKSCRLNRTTVWKIWRSIARAAGLPESLCRTHVAKHTCAMLMVNSGCSAFLVKQHLGHKSFDSTLAYVHPSDEDASKAMQTALAKAF
jgi:type 1 fimbriae regulatory protein FimB